MGRKHIVLNRWVTATAVVLVAASASAQTPTPQTEADQVKARQKISMMEGVLERAVANGAENLFQQIRVAMPTPDGPRLIGAPEVRGFPIAGYGVFFDVVVPDLMLPPMWSLRYTMDRNGVSANTALNELKTLVSSIRDPDQRQQFMSYINRLEIQVGPAQPAPQAQARQAGPATVSAQALGQPVPAQARPDDLAVLNDPNEGYTREVKNAIVDAMLDTSGSIPLGPEEWLMVAARGNVRGDLSVTDNADTHTIILRVKGSDLAAYRAGRITPDEARKRVDIREY